MYTFEFFLGTDRGWDGRGMKGFGCLVRSVQGLTWYLVKSPSTLRKYELKLNDLHSHCRPSSSVHIDGPFLSGLV